MPFVSLPLWGPLPWGWKSLQALFGSRGFPHFFPSLYSVLLRNANLLASFLYNKCRVARSFETQAVLLALLIWSEDAFIHVIPWNILQYNISLYRSTVVFSDAVCHQMSLTNEPEYTQFRYLPAIGLMITCYQHFIQICSAPCSTLSVW